MMKGKKEALIKGQMEMCLPRIGSNLMKGKQLIMATRVRRNKEIRKQTNLQKRKQMGRDSRSEVRDIKEGKSI